MDDQIRIEGYCINRRDRVSNGSPDPETSGGCVTNHKHNLQAIPMNDKYDGGIEAVWTEFTIHSLKILIGNVYRHPKETSFFEKSQSVLKKAYHKREI